MKLPLPLLFLIALWTTANKLPAQDCLTPQGRTYLYGNNIRALITQGGSLFFDGDEAAFQAPANEPQKTIFAQGLWLGALDPGGNLRVAAQTYGLANQETDYFAGPLNDLGATDAASCQDWDRVWSVYRYQIEAHIADFADNGVIDNPIPEIMGWPGRNNPNFLEVNGFELPATNQELAPYFDYDGDGLYDPLSGDYPIVHQSVVIPEQITWNVFNDAGGLHTQSFGNPLQMEVQLTTWAFNCSDNPILNNTIFTSYKLYNRGVESLDSLHLAIWTDFDLGCYTDDFVGSAPELNSFFVYNQDNIDGEVGDACPNGVNSYGENPPVQGVTVLNQDLSYFMYYYNNFDGPPGTTDPALALDFYRFMTGHWRDGTPLTYGGDGYDPTSSLVTPYAFPDDPNDPDGWSGYTEGLYFGDRRVVASVSLGSFPPGAIAAVDLAYSFYREEGADHLENVTAMYDGIGQLQGWYDNQFETVCSQPVICLEDCIWAGDLNADGIANHCDLLPLVMALGESGATRSGPYNWSPQDGAAWAATQMNGANDKHLDADGSGTLTTDDFLLTLQHYNRTRPGYSPEAVYDEGPELQAFPLGPFGFGGLSTGETGLFRIRLAEEVPGLYGLAFTLEYDNRYFEAIAPLTDTYFPNVAQVAIDDPGQGGMDFARIAPSDTVTILPGTLVNCNFKVRPDILASPLPADTSLIRFKNIKAIRADGTVIPIGGMSVTATFEDVIISSAREAARPDIQLFPNPTSGALNLSTQGQTVYLIELFSPTGQLLWRRAGSIRDGEAIQLGHLPDGLYYVRLRVGQGMVVEKVVVRR